MRKDTLKKLTACLLALILIISSAPITASAAQVQLSGNELDGYSVNMPVTGTDTLNLADKQNGFTFKVYDDGGASGDYSLDCDGYLQITAGSDYLIRISGSGNSESSSYDWLNIYDGADSSAPTLGGDSYGKYSGSPFTVSPIHSNSNVVTLGFRSDGSKNYSGFDLDVTIAALSSFATLSFAAGDGTGTMNSISVDPNDNVTVPECGFNVPSGMLFSHYTDGTNDYHPGEVIALGENKTLTAVYVNKVTVTYAFGSETSTAEMEQGAAVTLPAFTSLFTLPEQKLFKNWLCGETQYNEGDQVTVNDNMTFTAVLEDVPVIQHNDTYNYDYVLVPKSISVTANLNGKSAGYQLRIFDNGGPGADYSNDCDGSITILAPQGCVLGVSGSYSTESNYDYLCIYDGATTSSKQLVMVCGDNMTLTPIFASGTALTIRLITDGSSTRTGLDLTVTAYDPSDFATLSFNAGGGEGTMDSIIALPGAEVTVPACGFTIPEDKLFSHFTDGVNNYQPGDTITLNENKTLTAVYINKLTVTYSYSGITQSTSVAQGTAITLPAFSSMFEASSGSTFLGWQCGETLYNENDSFTVNENVTFTASVEEPQVVFGDDLTGWYANMPVTGTSTADISDKSGGFTLHVYDDGGSGQSYSNNCSGYLRIVAHSGYLLRFSGEGSTESGYDYLRLYDGDTDKVLGYNKNQGGFTITSAMTSGNVLKLYFYSDYSSTYSGFNLTVTVIDPASLATLSLNSVDGTGTMNSIRVLPGENVTVPACEFTAPEHKMFDHYTDGENDYLPGDVITLNANKTLTAIFATKAVITYVYNENSATDNVVQGTAISLPTFISMFSLPERKHFSGWQSGGTTYSEGDTFTVNGDVTFTALVEDDPVVLHGESGTSYANYENYSLLPRSSSVTADLTGVSEGYTLWVFDDGGVNGNYSNGCNGSITVLAPEGCIMQIGSDVSTELSCDYLYVYDGDSENASQIGRFSGSNGTGKLYSTGNAVTVRFYSDGRKNYRGIDMKIIVTRPESLITVSFDPGEGSGTMQDLKFLSGDLFSVPACTFTLPEKTYFDHYTDGTRNYSERDHLYITEDLHLTAVYIEKIIITYQGEGGQTATADYRKGSQFYLSEYEVRFSRLPYRKELKQWRNETDHEAYAPQTLVTANADTTYTAEFESLPYLIDDENGGYYALMPVVEQIDDFDLSDRQNGFTFKLYDNGGQNIYANNCDGSLTLTAPTGCVFRFSGEGLTEQDCDILSIYDSDGTTLLGGSTYSGSFTLTDLQTSSNTLTVQFTSNSYSSRAGFMLDIMIVDPSTLITISFDAGEGEGSMDPITVISGKAVTLPDYGFTAPESKIFSGYSDGTNIYWPGNSVTYNANATLTAQWAAATGFTYTCKEESTAIRYPLGSTVTLPELTDLFTLPAGMHFTGWEEKFSGTVYQAGDSYVANAPTVFTAQLEILYPDATVGWYALMPLWNVNDPLLIDLSQKSSGFTFTLYDDGGSGANYSDDNNAMVVVKAPENMVVMLSGSGVTESASYDYLKFYNGSSSSAQILGNTKYGGSFMISEPLMTDSNYLSIYFHSDSSINSTGFALTITVAAPVAVTYDFDGETQIVAAQKNSTIQLAEFGDLFSSETKEFVCWQNGNNTYDEGDDFVVTDNITFTAVTRLMPTVTFDGSGATMIGGNGETVTPAIPFPTGTTEPLPNASEIFNFPANKYFGGWTYNGRLYVVGEEFTLTENVTFTAVWRDANAWDLLGETLNATSGTNLGTVTLTEDTIAAVGSLPLTVPAGVTVTINLNGHTLDGTNAAVMGNGSVILVHGALTLIDSASGATITGGSIQEFFDGSFNAAAFESCFGAKMLMTYDYDNNDTGEEFVDQLYATVWFPTLREAFVAAQYPKMFKSELTNLPENNSFWYNDYTVMLLSDATIPAGETWEVNSFDSIRVDLNGHTFEVQGTFTGGIEGTSWKNGQEIPKFYPTNIQIESTIPGTFRSCGTIGVSLAPWTADTYYITGGTVSGFFSADGGIFHISGGHFTDIVMFNNGNEDAELEIELFGDAEFDRLEHMIYSNDGAPTIHMTIGDNVRVGAMLFDIMGDGVVNYPVLTVSGGYFTVDPRTWLEEADGDANVVQILTQPEQYSDQTDWAADSTVYTWRVKTLLIGDVNLDGKINVLDVTAIQRHLAEVEPLTGDALLAADTNGDGQVTVEDVTYLARYIAEFNVTLGQSA